MSIKICLKKIDWFTCLITSLHKITFPSMGMEVVIEGACRSLWGELWSWLLLLLLLFLLLLLRATFFILSPLGWEESIIHEDSLRVERGGDPSAFTSNNSSPCQRWLIVGMVLLSNLGVGRGLGLWDGVAMLPPNFSFPMLIGRWESHH